MRNTCLSYVVALYTIISVWIMSPEEPILVHKATTYNWHILSDYNWDEFYELQPTYRMWRFNFLILLWHLYITVNFTLTDLVTLVYKGTPWWWWCLCIKTCRSGIRRRKVLASNIVNLLVNKSRIYKNAWYTQFPISTNVLCRNFCFML